MITKTSIRVLLVLALLPLGAAAQTAAPAGSPPAETNAKAHADEAAQSKAVVSAGAAPGVDEKSAGPRTGVLVDQVIGVVNGDLILESDVEEERRFGAFQPFTEPSGSFSRDTAITRLVDRALILQQAKLQPGDAVSPGEAKAQLAQLRKDIPLCKTTYHCETDAGWAKFVAAQGFTMDELVARWQERMEILKFIEERFRAGIRITPAEIKTYYDSLLPEYAKRNAKAPPLAEISDRLQEVLLQQRVSALLADWLLQLKAQGSVRMMRPGEVAP